MEYKTGDRVLYNRQKFGTVRSSQFNPREVDVVFDREKSKIVAVRVDMLELVADAQHEAILTAQINAITFADAEPGLAAELTKLANELAEGADLDTNMLRVRANMKSVASRLRNIAKDL